MFHKLRYDLTWPIIHSWSISKNNNDDVAKSDWWLELDLEPFQGVKPKPFPFLFIKTNNVSIINTTEIHHLQLGLLLLLLCLKIPKKSHFWKESLRLWLASVKGFVGIIVVCFRERLLLLERQKEARTYKWVVLDPRSHKQKVRDHTNHLSNLF